MRSGLPFFLGVLVAGGLFLKFRWWGFWVIFPWIGLAISWGLYVAAGLPRERRSLGRRRALLAVLPVFILFIPIANHENLQLEGIVLLLSIGYFSKGVIHYAVAKVVGPLFWGRGFCAWACWTAAVLEWLPVPANGRVPGRLKKLRYVVLAISLLVPAAVILWWNYDVRQEYLHHGELAWMLGSNALYYLAAVPLAFYFQDQRAFCKILCPVSLVMKVPARFNLRPVRAGQNSCIRCGQCSQHCPMEVDVMGAIAQGLPVRDTECILCRSCGQACPVEAIR